MELVAPAGNYNALVAAVNNGADAVYLGLPDFGARAKAENFTFDSLKDAIAYAHLFGTKVFVTLNTLIKDDEMPRAIDSAKTAYLSGADAAIVQDVRLIKNLKRELPDFTLHASTQMGIHNAEGARAILDMGLCRAVLARETLPQDIVEIKKTGIDIEFFVQGALCICFSGNCYFSSLASSYSGNRGKCMQLCRKKYDFHGSKGYYLSAKDICLYDKLAYLESLGVDAVKIEGRMRSSEYVSQAVRVYKSQMPTDDAVRALKSVFNRGNYCSAYLDDNAQFRIVYPKSQSNIGVSIGKIDKVSGNNRVQVNGFSPNNADGFKIMRNGNEIGGASVRGGAITADRNVKVGDELRRTFDGKLSEELSNVTRKIPVSVEVQICSGKPISCAAKSDVCGYALTGKVVEPAVNRALSVDDVTRVFKKVSDIPFDVTVNVITDNNAFMPISELNEIRRNLYGALKDKIASFLPVRHEGKPFSLQYNEFCGRGKILAVDDLSVITEDIAQKVDYIALKPRDYSTVESMSAKYRFNDKKLLLSMPVTMRGEDSEVLRRAVDCEKIFGVISNNYYTLEFTDKPILLGTGHNIIGRCEKTHIRSFEADDPGGDGNSFMYCFGYAPVMTLCHCIYGKCVNCNGEDSLIDESGRKFTLKRYKTAHCYWELNNCVPHNFTDNKTVKNVKNLYYDCCGMDPSGILRALNGEYSGKFTRGNTNKGLK